jgi:hypothetical protein
MWLHQMATAAKVPHWLETDRPPKGTNGVAKRGAREMGKGVKKKEETKKAKLETGRLFQDGQSVVLVAFGGSQVVEARNVNGDDDVDALKRKPLFASRLKL